MVSNCVIFSGHFYLTNLLLDKLKSSAPSRIVTVSSGGHEYHSLDWNDLQTSQRWTSLKSYCRSKTANVLFSTHLAKILQGSKDIHFVVYNIMSGRQRSVRIEIKGWCRGNGAWSGSSVGKRVICHMWHRIPLGFSGMWRGSRVIFTKIFKLERWISQNLKRCYDRVISTCTLGQEIWANAHETRHSISLISYAGCLALSPVYFSENSH